MACSLEVVLALAQIKFDLGTRVINRKPLPHGASNPSKGQEIFYAGELGAYASPQRPHRKTETGCAECE